MIKSKLSQSVGFMFVLLTSLTINFALFIDIHCYWYVTWCCVYEGCHSFIETRVSR